MNKGNYKQKSIAYMIRKSLHNFNAVGLINLFTAIKLTYLLMEISRLYKARDTETTKHNTIQYWAELLKIKPPKYPYLG
ncbi:hypothetical protein VB620_14520 [Nodularia harveyana UHCC-0300]|uniref:Transposase n=1 Tax=Nodularia harveyana UHCC-0300 TaxID=2974287 RepID=A0ABU5UGB7_9CYAN|nr:hypothetical protein [Nodularia harveyana]MEA5582550.1 hypothetical protein [Nodularia harveyana UHCC-0300]